MPLTVLEHFKYKYVPKKPRVSVESDTWHATVAGTAIFWPFKILTKRAASSPPVDSWTPLLLAALNNVFAGGRKDMKFWSLLILLTLVVVDAVPVRRESAAASPPCSSNTELWSRPCGEESDVLGRHGPATRVYRRTFCDESMVEIARNLVDLESMARTTVEIAREIITDYVSLGLFLLLKFVSSSYLFLYSLRPRKLPAAEAIMYLLCPAVPRYVPCQHRDFIRFARIQNVFRWNLREVITATSRWTGCILGEIISGTRQQDTTEDSNRRKTGAAT